MIDLQLFRFNTILCICIASVYLVIRCCEPFPQSCEEGNLQIESAAKKGKVINPSYRRNLEPEEMLTVLLFRKLNTQSNFTKANS